jgi:predicted esterase
MRVAFVLVMVAALPGCRRQTPAPPAPLASSSSSSSSSSSTAPAAPSAEPPRPVGVETVDGGDDLPAFVVRASAPSRDPRAAFLFIPGMCVHPGGYIQAFQYAAAARGDLVALQGDVSCDSAGSARRWSGDLETMNRRIEKAFRDAGLGEPSDVVVIGYSQGAERAQRLVARWPSRYTRAVLIASPVTPSPLELGRARAVVLMAGTFDGAQASMREAVAPLRRAGVAATFIELRGARHGQMGLAPEPAMAEALDFVLETKNVKTAASAPSHERPPAR